MSTSFCNTECVKIKGVDRNGVIWYGSNMGGAEKENTFYTERWLMKNSKIKEIQEPVCGIHTICLITDNVVSFDVSERANNCITKRHTFLYNETGEIRTKMVINANKWFGKNGWCKSWEEYRLIMDRILGEAGIYSFTYNRVDFAVNFLEDNYDSLHKLHKCICLLAASQYNIRNRYESTDPLNLNHLTTRVQGEYIQIENYNKKIESKGNSQFSNRLEFRNKALDQRKTNFESVERLAENWSRRFISFVAQYGRMSADCNKFLLDRWYNEQGENVKNMTEFIRKYQDNVFSAEQLTELYSAMGVKNPKGSVKNYKRYNYIEFISKDYVNKYLNVIDKSLKAYVSEGAITAQESNIIRCNNSHKNDSSMAS